MRWTVLSLCLLVAGCGHYEWIRSRPGPGDFAGDRYLCQRDSLAVAPVAEVIQIERERDRRGRRETVTAVDANADNRSNLFESCMASRGWEQIYIDDTSPRTVATAPPAPVPQPPPPAGYPPPPPAGPSGGLASGALPPPRSLSARNLAGFREYLANTDLHKAFAVSSSGAYGWQSRRASRQEAISAALDRCAQYAGDCRVYAVDNEAYSGD